MTRTDLPEGDPERPATGAAPHFYWARPVTLCTDNRPDDDDGPPNWTTDD